MSSIQQTPSYTSRWLDADAEHKAPLGADGARVRYIKIGRGPNLVLIHTVRTQLDLFQFVVPKLAAHFTVYALDLPGFGWSDIPAGAKPDEPMLRARVKEFLSVLQIDRPVLVGESIGATLALSVAADLGDAVERVVAFNTYDYLPGLERANLLASVIIKSVRAPIVGPIFAALENRSIVAGIMRGGVHDPQALPEDLLDEYARVGQRPGYSTFSRAVYKALPSFVAARQLYPKIKAPVTLVWGDEDWSTREDRAAVETAVPSAQVITLAKTGHFSALEKPEDFARIVVAAAGSQGEQLRDAAQRIAVRSALEIDVYEQTWSRTLQKRALKEAAHVRGDDWPADATSVIAESWKAEDGSYRGRPVDVAELRDRSLLMSDDFAGAVFRVSYVRDVARLR